jgi:pimeloyl-ACP methyl ester carboxylesterase
MGISFGGCLVLRAAAYEPRVKRAIACDICFDVFSIWLEKLPPAKRAVLETLYRLNAASIYNALMEQAMQKSLVVDWGVRHGMYIVGAKTPFEHLKISASFNTADVSPLVKQDVLLLAGTEDFGVPIKQFYQQIEALKNVRSLTARMFTRAEQAQNHCQVGNLSLLLDVIATWIDQTCRNYR